MLEQNRAHGRIRRVVDDPFKGMYIGDAECPSTKTDPFALWSPAPLYPCLTPYLFDFRIAGGLIADRFDGPWNYRGRRKR